MASISVVHLVPTDDVGGVEVAARVMAMRQDLPCRFYLRFILPTVTGRSVTGIVRYLAGCWRSLRSVRAFDPDVIICSLWPSVPVALALRRLRPRAKLVYFLHIDAPAHRIDALLSRLAMRAADEIWGDSPAVLAARGVPADRGRVISFVTDRLEPAAPPIPTARFVSWGRLHHQKGIDRSIRLVALLAARGMDAHYDIYGPDGGERSTLQTLAASLGIADRVRFGGPVSRNALPEIAADHGFFLQLSRSEGMCIAAVEAMQLGLVPVATAVGQMAHYVTPGGTGVRVDPDRLDAAADEIGLLIGDEAVYRDRSDGARRHWLDAPLYADDVCAAATELVRRF